jgi:hypothetical protein
VSGRIHVFKDCQKPVVIKIDRGQSDAIEFVLHLVEKEQEIIKQGNYLVFVEEIYKFGSPSSTVLQTYNSIIWLYYINSLFRNSQSRKIGPGD